jgi:hypothetical protein
MGVGGQCHTPSPLPLGKSLSTLCAGCCAGSRRSGWEWNRKKSLAPPGFEPRTVQHTVSRRTNNAIPAIITTVLFEIPSCALQTIHGQMLTSTMGSRSTSYLHTFVQFSMKWKKKECTAFFLTLLSTCITDWTILNHLATICTKMPLGNKNCIIWLTG